MPPGLSAGEHARAAGGEVSTIGLLTSQVRHASGSEFATARSHDFFSFLHFFHTDGRRRRSH